MTNQFYKKQKMYSVSELCGIFKKTSVTINTAIRNMDEDDRLYYGIHKEGQEWRVPEDSLSLFKFAGNGPQPKTEFFKNQLPDF